MAKRLSKKAQRREAAKKKQAIDQRIARERDTFATGYSDPKLIRAAMNNHPGGAQKAKRDRLKWDGQNPRRTFQGGAPGLGKCS